MGRSVSTPSNAIVAYYDVSDFGHTYDNENDSIDYDSYCQWQAQDDWGYFKEGMIDQVKELFPSMSECEKWIGREDLAIAENQLAYFGVSEYCGVAAIWILAKEDEYGNDNPLAEAWVNKISKKFHSNFGQWNRVGVLSNGESIYEKKAA